MDRFFDNVDATGDCHIWLAGKTPNGYGRVTLNGKSHGAHRVAWCLSMGISIDHPSIDGMVVCHTCDVKECVNPSHLFLGTQKDNVADMLKKGRGNHPKGSAHHGAKLIEGDIPRIRDMIRCGATSRSIANLFKVSPATICLINTGKIWAHI